MSGAPGCPERPADSGLILSVTLDGTEALKNWQGDARRITLLLLSRQPAAGHVILSGRVVGLPGQIKLRRGPVAVAAC